MNRFNYLSGYRKPKSVYKLEVGDRVTLDKSCDRSHPAFINVGKKGVITKFDQTGMYGYFNVMWDNGYSGAFGPAVLEKI